MRQATVLALLLVVALLSGCGGGGKKAYQGTTTNAQKGPVDKGDITVSYLAPKSATDRQVEQLLKESGILEATAKLNDALAFPHDIKIVVEPGDPGPYFDPNTKTIHLQYGFVALADQQFQKQDPKISPADLAVADVEVTEFVVMHELGHALIDLYHIPVLGREEDAVDALATVFMTKYVGGQTGTEIALKGAEFFADISEAPKSLAIADFADEHSLSLQRALAIICWVAGSSQKNYEAIASEHIFTKERLQRCPEEYQQKVTSWEQVLRPHIKR